MRKYLLLLFFTLFSFSAIHAEITWNLSEDGTLTISGTGDIPGSGDAPWFSRSYEIKKVIIKDGVTNIGNNAFFDYPALTSVEIPNSVTSIGESAFFQCMRLTSVTIGNSLTRIGKRAFENCVALLSVEFPNSLTNIEEFAFQNCFVLTSITIPNSVTSIGNNAFVNCVNLKSFTFKGSTPPELEINSIFTTGIKIPVYVPANSIEVYKDALGDNYDVQANPKQLFLTGNNFYLQDSQIDGADVSFTRDFSTNWEAIYLPFSLKYEDWKDDFEVARINGIHQYDKNDDGRIDKNELEFVKMTDDESVIYPNTPYLIKAKKAGEKTLSVENTTVYKADVNQIECSTTTEKFIFRGNYKRIPYFVINTEGYYIIENGQLSNNPVNSLTPYRWYMKRENRNSAYGINNNNTAKEISIRVVGEETTGVANIQHASPNTQTYDLNGRKVNENNLKPGIYVRNGRKFVVK